MKEKIPSANKPTGSGQGPLSSTNPEVRHAARSSGEAMQKIKDVGLEGAENAAQALAKQKRAEMQKLVDIRDGIQKPGSLDARSAPSTTNYAKEAVAPTPERTINFADLKMPSSRKPDFAPHTKPNKVDVKDPSENVLSWDKLGKITERRRRPGD